MPSNLLPIDIDPGDSLICLAIKGDDFGYVYCCDLDYFEEDNKLKEEFIKVISNDFQGFVNE
nr:hypothetical protein [Priestia aryabhattai]